MGVEGKFGVNFRTAELSRTGKPLRGCVVMSLRGNENGPCERREAISKVLKNNEIATPAIKSGGLAMTKGVMTQPLD